MKKFLLALMLSTISINSYAEFEFELVNLYKASTSEFNSLVKKAQKQHGFPRYSRQGDSLTIEDAPQSLADSHIYSWKRLPPSKKLMMAYAFAKHFRNKDDKINSDEIHKKTISYYSCLNTGSVYVSLFKRTGLQKKDNTLLEVGKLCTLVSLDTVVQSM